MIVPPRFTQDDASRANDEWGCNCGPSALAAMADVTLDEVRMHMGDFESKGYTNPTLMLESLERIGVRFRSRGLASNVPLLDWPRYGLARIQWEGPWTLPGVPIRVRYRQTHWVGAAHHNGDVGIFDINAMSNGDGWCWLKDWREIIVPWILKECVPRASGAWHITHSIEMQVERVAG